MGSKYNFRDSMKKDSGASKLGKAPSLNKKDFDFDFRETLKKQKGRIRKE